MIAATSLRASSDAFYRMGRETDAARCREMADDAHRFGTLGNDLYRHWAAAMAQRATDKLNEGTIL